MTPDIYVEALAHALGDEACTVEEAAARARLTSPAATLRRAGFVRHHVCSGATTAYHLAWRTMAQLRGCLDEVDVVVYAGASRTSAPRPLPATLDLGHATMLGLAEQGAAGALGALRIGAAVLRCEPAVRRVLCLAAHHVPEGERYEQAASLVSDGAAACLLSREPGAFRMIASHAIPHGASGHPSDDEAAGAHFPYMNRLIRTTLAAAGLGVGDLAWIVPQNTHAAVWTILARLLKIDYRRIWLGTLADVGHVVGADVLIGLQRLDAQAPLRRGDRALLVTAGPGTDWQSLLLEKR